jgi:hypothetical protein
MIECETRTVHGRLLATTRQTGLRWFANRRPVLELDDGGGLRSRTGSGSSVGDGSSGGTGGAGGSGSGGSGGGSGGGGGLDGGFWVAVAELAGTAVGMEQLLFAEEAPENVGVVGLGGSEEQVQERDGDAVGAGEARQHGGVEVQDEDGLAEGADDKGETAEQKDALQEAVAVEEHAVQDHGHMREQLDNNIEGA